MLEADEPAEKRGRWEAGWSPRFDRWEIWILNTEYRLYGSEGPQVTKAATHIGRLDEMAKCLGVAPGQAALRFFWADATISIEGPDLGDWQYWIGKRAPSEQQMANFLLPNIEAAWRGETRTRTLEEAKEVWYEHATWYEPAPACLERGGQPTPGINVQRSFPIEGEDWLNIEEQCLPRDWRHYTWPTRPTRTSAEIWLKAVRSNRWSHRQLLEAPSEAAVGVLLDVDGADVRFISQSPLSKASLTSGRRGTDPSACITVLGGPKGISDPFKTVIREVFFAAGVPLLEACLGPREEMAHACVAFLRLQEDAGLFKAAMVDLLRTGKKGYQVLMDRVEAACVEAGAASTEAAAAEGETSEA